METNEPTNQRTTERIGSLRVYAVHAPRFAQEGDDQSGRGREGRVQYFVGAPAGGRGRGAHRGARQAPNRCGLYGAWLYYLSWFGGRLVVFLFLAQLRPLCSCFSSPSCHRHPHCAGATCAAETRRPGSPRATPNESAKLLTSLKFNLLYKKVEILG